MNNVLYSRLLNNYLYIQHVTNCSQTCLHAPSLTRFYKYFKLSKGNDNSIHAH